MYLNRDRDLISKVPAFIYTGADPQLDPATLYVISQHIGDERAIITQVDGATHNGTALWVTPTKDLLLHSFVPTPPALNAPKRGSGIARKIDHLGRCVIPKELRISYGCLSGTTVIFRGTPEGLLLTKSDQICAWMSTGSSYVTTCKVHTGSTPDLSGAYCPYCGNVRDTI